LTSSFTFLRARQKLVFDSRREKTQIFLFLQDLMISLQTSDRTLSELVSGIHVSESVRRTWNIGDGLACSLMKNGQPSRIESAKRENSGK
jgi:hypothetical protein